MQAWLSVDERLIRAREAYRLEKEAHRRTKDELEKLKAHVAQLEAKASTYAVGAECEGEGPKRFGMVDKKVDYNDDPMNEGVREGEGRGVRGGACVEDEVSVQAETGTVPERATVEGQGEEEGNAGTVRSRAPSPEPSIGKNREHESQPPCSGVTPMHTLNDGDRRASNVVTRMKTKPRTRKPSVLRVSPYTNPLLRRMGRHKPQRSATVMRGRGSRFGFKYGRKVRTENELVSGSRSPETGPESGPTVTQRDESVVSVFSEYEFMERQFLMPYFAM